jgi:hypothetical protein
MNLSRHVFLPVDLINHCIQFEFDVVLIAELSYEMLSAPKKIFFLPFLRRISIHLFPETKKETMVQYCQTEQKTNGDIKNVATSEESYRPPARRPKHQQKRK